MESSCPSRSHDNSSGWASEPCPCRHWSCLLWMAQPDTNSYYIEHRTMCGLWREPAGAEGSPVIDGYTFVWSPSPPGTNYSQECDFCSVGNSTTAAAFSSSHLIVVSCAECCLLLWDDSVDVTSLWTHRLSFKTM